MVHALQSLFFKDINLFMFLMNMRQCNETSSQKESIFQMIERSSSQVKLNSIGREIGGSG